MVLKREDDLDALQVVAKIQYPSCGYFSVHFPGKKKE
jgi:hypothetical protein